LDKHEFYIDRCLELAQKSLGFTAPNPLVGSVIIKDGKIVAEGCHQEFGKPHAEVNAIANLPTDIEAKDCTLYVNLEPCNHQGKTPPCSEAIVKAGIRKVVIGTRDPHSKVDGSGIKYLKDNGIDIVEGVLSEKCAFVNRRFNTFHKKKRPYVILKWAESLDGFMGKPGERIQISAIDSQKLNHKWRSEEAAILIGKNTYLTDLPKLDARLWNNNNPAKFLLWGNSDFRLNLDSWNVWKNSNINDLLIHMHNEQVQSAIVEGGRKVLNAFISSDLYDEIRIIKSREVVMGAGIKAPKSPNLNYHIKSLNKDDVLEGIR